MTEITSNGIHDTSNSLSFAHGSRKLNLSRKKTCKYSTPSQMLQMIDTVLLMFAANSDRVPQLNELYSQTLKSSRRFVLMFDYVPKGFFGVGVSVSNSKTYS